MSLAAGKLRHRVVIQQPVETQDGITGAMEVSWADVATVWASIEPLSAREFIASQAEDSQISARITIRYRAGISAKMRLYHQAKGLYYDIHGPLSDKESGLEYITIPVSEGLKYTQSSSPAPVNLVEPTIGGTPEVGDVLEASDGTWANEPTSITYQWYRGGSVLITGATNYTYLLTVDDEGLNMHCEVTATNSSGSNSAETPALGPVVP